MPKVLPHICIGNILSKLRVDQEVCYIKTPTAKHKVQMTSTLKNILKHVYERW